MDRQATPMTALDPRKIFLSYNGKDRAMACLLKFFVENELEHLGVWVWLFEQHQSTSARNLKDQIRREIMTAGAMIFLVSPHTLEQSPTQWLELGMATAFETPCHTLLHYVQIDDAKDRAGILFEDVSLTLVEDYESVVTHLARELEAAIRIP